MIPTTFEPEPVQERRPQEAIYAPEPMPTVDPSKLFSGEGR